MNKTKMILAGTGGAIGLVVLVLAFLVWQAFSAKTAAVEGDEEEGTDGLETVETRAQKFSRSPIYPCAASVTAIAKNQREVDDWRKEGLTLAARGDKAFPKTTPAQFKTDLVADAKRLMALPGGVGGKLVKPDFAFGPFKGYIAEGKMPAEAELTDLQRKWDDVATITALLATNGVVEIMDVQFATAKAAKADENKKDKRNVRGKRVKGKSAQVAPASCVASVAFSYVFTFAARPPALVAALNTLASSERFITVDTLFFSRPTDAIAAALGGDEKKAESSQASGGRRGRRGRRGAEAVSTSVAENGTEKATNGLVTDPALDAPMTVTMTVTIHDFRSREEKKEKEAGK